VNCLIAAVNVLAEHYKIIFKINLHKKVHFTYIIKKIKDLNTFLLLAKEVSSQKIED
jgi:hypothetical protein